MKCNIRWTAQGLLAALMSMACASGQVEKMAVVNASNVNVRGQPTLHSEVVTQLQKGDVVQIFEELEVEEPSAGEPAAWAKIQMPAEIPVWVYAPYIDPGSMSVNVDRLNMRAGPGENFSIAGRIDRGTQVERLEMQGDWMSITAPTNAYAFVALTLLDIQAATQPMDLAQADRSAETSRERSQPARSDADVETSISPSPSTNPPAIRIPDDPASPIDTTLADRQAPVATSLEPEDPAIPDEVPEAKELEEVAPAAPEIQKRRIVRREGIVRSAISVQAPSFFELISTDTRRTINYLHNPNPELSLRDYRGRRVIVMGEEGLDQRWPNTPVIEVEKIELTQ